MPPQKKANVPAQVLERARALAADTVKKPRAPQAASRTAPNAKRDKLVAALKKLHPMD